MLTRGQLYELYRSLRDSRVLSVYIDGSLTDPALQRSWRVQLDHTLDDLRRWLDGSAPGERKELEQCVQLLDSSLTTVGTNVRARGWAAFITPGRLHYAEPLPVTMPTLAVWSTGPCVAPYVRALKEHRAVILVLADARHASIYEYRLGELERADEVHAHHVIDRPEHMGAAPRAGFHTGTRGSTAREATQRSLLEGRDRMLAEAAHRVSELAGLDGWILVGGIRRVTSRLVQTLADVAPNRVLELESLDVHSSGADIAAAARAGASVLRNTADDMRLAEIADLANAHGLGTLGPAETREALRQSSVRELYLTHRYLDDHPLEAEEAIRGALEQDAIVEEVSGSAAERLDQHGGMAGGLRFRPATLEAHAGGSYR